MYSQCYSIPRHPLDGVFLILILQIRTSKAQSELRSGSFMIQTVRLPPNCVPSLQKAFLTHLSKRPVTNPGCRLSCSDAEGQETEPLGIKLRLFPSSSGRGPPFRRFLLFHSTGGYFQISPAHHKINIFVLLSENKIQDSIVPSTSPQDVFASFISEGEL